MPFVVHNIAGERITSRKKTQAEWHELKALNKTAPFSFPDCRMPASLATSSKGVMYFRHLPSSNCDGSSVHGGPMSPEHEAAQFTICDGVERAGWEAELEFPGPVNEWRADVIAKSPAGAQVVLEVQRSSQTSARYRVRQARYWGVGVHCFWFSSHSRTIAADWDTRLGFPIVAVDLAPGVTAEIRRAREGRGFRDRLEERFQSSTLDFAAEELLASDYASTTRQAQEVMARIIDDGDPDPDLLAVIGDVDPEWLTSARVRIEAKFDAAQEALRIRHAEWDRQYRKSLEKQEREDQARADKREENRLRRLQEDADAAVAELAERAARAERDKVAEIANAAREARFAVLRAEREKAEADEAERQSAEREARYQRQLDDQERLRIEERIREAARIKAMDVGVAIWETEIRGRRVREIATANPELDAARLAVSNWEPSGITTPVEPRYVSYVADVVVNAYLCGGCWYEWRLKSFIPQDLVLCCPEPGCDFSVITADDPAMQVAIAPSTHGKKCSGATGHVRDPRVERPAPVTVQVTIPSHKCAI